MIPGMSLHADFPLHAHASMAGIADAAIQVHVDVRIDGDLFLRYVCKAPPTLIRLPPRRIAAPADELWRHTCCELFIGVVGRPMYREFNFSPSGEWAVYAFRACRERVAYQPEAAPRIDFAVDDTGWALEATIPFCLLPAGGLDGAELALSVVLEHADGGLGYWALHHHGEKPDFHDRAGFILRGSNLGGT